VLDFKRDGDATQLLGLLEPGLSHHLTQALGLRAASNLRKMTA